MNAPISRKGEASGTPDLEATRTKARSERAALAQKIARREAKRALQLETGDDLEAVDKLDHEIDADRRLLALIDQRLAVLDRSARKQERQHREDERTAAIKNIAPLLARRTELGIELETVLKRLVELHDQIIADKQIRAVWPFGFPDYFSFRIDDFGREILRRLRDNGGYDLMPGPVRAALGHSSGTGGYTQVPSPSGPNDLPGKLAENAKHILSVLEKAQIHPAGEPDEADDYVKVA